MVAVVDMRFGRLGGPWGRRRRWPVLKPGTWVVSIIHGAFRALRGDVICSHTEDGMAGDLQVRTAQEHAWAPNSPVVLSDRHTLACQLRTSKREWGPWLRVVLR